MKSFRVVDEKACLVRVMIFALSVVCSTSPVCFAAVYYVATNGNDDAAGTLAEPWRTPQKAADTLVAGDTVYVRQGVYTGEVSARNSGSPTQWITYAAYSNETPTLDGLALVPEWGWGGVFSIYGRRFIWVEGFRVVRSAYAGILAEESSDIVLRNNWTSNTWSSGLAAWRCTNVVIESNRVQLACQGDGDLQECITVSGTLDFEVRGNRVWERPIETGSGGEGITVKDACRNGRVEGNIVHDLYRLGIYIDAEGETLTNIAVSANVVYDCAYGVVTASEAGGLLRDVRVFNNVLYSNRYIGIESAQIGADGPQSDILLYNNTIVGNGHAQGWGGGIAISSRNPQNRRFTVHNNLCSDNYSWQVATVPMDTNLTVSLNLLDAYQGYVDGDFVEVMGTSAIAGSPRFVAPAAANYRLKPGSPAIDAGTEAPAPMDDLDGQLRPADGNADGTAAIDVGAFEFTPPRLTRIECTGPVSRLAWDSVTGAVYRVQFSPSLISPAWSNIFPDVTASGASTEAEAPSVSGATQRFYRVSMPGD